MTAAMHRLVLGVVFAGCWTNTAAPPVTSGDTSPVRDAGADAVPERPTSEAGTPRVVTAGILGSTSITSGGAFDHLVDAGAGGPPPGQIGQGAGIGGKRGRTAQVPTIALGRPTTTAGLAPTVVRRYVKRSLDRLQYCYEKQLVAAPSLAGTVTARFVIGEDGKVRSSTATGLPSVDACVADTIRRIAFPPPTEGAKVTAEISITYKPPG